MPAENRVGLDNLRHFLQGLLAELLADLSEGLALAITQLDATLKPTISPLIIPLLYYHINGFQRASSLEKPWPGGEKRRDGQASHHETW